MAESGNKGGVSAGGHLVNRPYIRLSMYDYNKDRPYKIALHNIKENLYS